MLKLKKIEEMKEEELQLVDRGKNTMIDMVTPQSFESISHRFWEDNTEVFIEFVTLGWFY